VIVTVKWFHIYIYIYAHTHTAIFYATMFGNVTLLVHTLDFSYREFREKMDTINQFIRLNEVCSCYCCGGVVVVVGEPFFLVLVGAHCLTHFVFFSCV